MFITRACISINNRCNLKCSYCHFREKTESIDTDNMDVIRILDNIMEHIVSHNIPVFKLGFVGNGEPFLDFDKLKKYVQYIEPFIMAGRIAPYTITNGTIGDVEKLVFLINCKVGVGFSLDSVAGIHNKLRCGTFDKVMRSVETYKKLAGTYPSFNCTVGRDVLENAEKTIRFFKKFGSRITFSRMIGQSGISFEEYHGFLALAQESGLPVRTGGYDCTMYGGMCGAGMDNVFFANNKVFLCGNCIDLPYMLPAETPLDEIHWNIKEFDRCCCFKDLYKEKQKETSVEAEKKGLL